MVQAKYLCYEFVLVKGQESFAIFIVVILNYIYIIGVLNGYCFAELVYKLLSAATTYLEITLHKSI